MALSQFIPDVKIGYLYTYWGPLCFVLLVTIFREAVDDFRRYQRDREVNSQKYRRLTLSGGLESVASSKLRVGDIIIVEKDERVPADLVLVRTSDKSGAVFVRTDQLDGETDWKLRLAVPATQKLGSDAELLNFDASVYIEKPQRDIHSFIGTFSRLEQEGSEESLDLQNTLWANTVVAAGSATGIVVYTGSETRSVMNNSQPRSKMGLLDMEINGLTKVLFCAVIGLAFVMMCLKVRSLIFKFLFETNFFNRVSVGLGTVTCSASSCSSLTLYQLVSALTLTWEKLSIRGKCKMIRK